MAELSGLITKRATIKGHLTRFQHLVESIPDSPEANDTKLLQLPMRLISAQPLLDDFNKIQIKIESLQQGAEEENYVERDAFENIYYTHLQIAKNLLARYNPNVSNQAQANQVSNANVPTLGSNFVNLPKIDLPTFSGDYQNWLEFRDTFNSLINSNNNISNTQKFHYLKSSLKGKASNIVHSIEFSEANYTIAWQTLLERYDDKWLIIYNHVKAIFNLPSITKENFGLLRQLHEDLTKHLHALKILSQPVEHWDSLIIYIISKKLDPISKREWEAYKYDSELPKVKDIQAFLKDKCRLLEKLHESVPSNFINYKEKSKYDKARNYSSSSFISTNSIHTKEPSCAFCKQPHTIYQCEEFLKLSIESRITAVKDKKLCINCLRGNHFSRNCKATACRNCGRKHNALLHLNTRASNTNTVAEEVEAQNTPQPSTSTTIVNHLLNDNNPVLLPTAMVKVLDKVGKLHSCRALLDSASQSHFITENLCHVLGLPKTKINLSVRGISQMMTNITSKVELTFQSTLKSYKSTISCIVLPNITGYLPSASFDTSSLNIPQNIALADVNFNKSSKIDLLIGAPIFFDLFCTGQVKLPNSKLILQKSKLGWVFSGPLGYQTNLHETHCNLSVAECSFDVQQQLTKFWNLEECSLTKALSREEKACEEHFANTTTRDPKGRFVVSIPLKESIDKLGDSRQSAITRFQALERKLQSNQNFRQQYVAFMREYEALGHMTEVTNDDRNIITYYLPHHGVVKETSVTTKLRVVFDGSAKSTTGCSVNELQMVGPVVQDDLFSILVRFRRHKYVLSADIEKMYRQVIVKPQQRDLQRIVWREKPSDKLKHYKLNTVTYGTAAASFLAIRALQQLGHENAAKYPQSSSIILRDFYVDDLLTGANSVEEAVRVRDEIANILLKGHFKLRKWVSNESAVLHEVPDSINSKTVNLGPYDNNKTLGLVWLPKTDTIIYNINLNEPSAPVTKRSILASTAKIFDPLGCLAPSIIIPKIILQRLWQYKLSWDESVPNDLHTQWLQFQNDMIYLAQTKIPRLVIIDNALEIELHGFSDACQTGYGACAYIRSADAAGNICVHLLCAKSKVAPIKTISIPRLELCGALLLARLINKVGNVMHVQFKRVICWSDSTVAIAWIKTPSNALKIFVGNRVSEIQDLTAEADWRHVSSCDNPADVLSRGIMPKQLLKTEIWWKGPKWLSLPEVNWPPTRSNISQESSYLSEKRSEANSLVSSINNELNLFKRFSSLKRMQRCLAYCLRFKFNTLNPPHLRRLNSFSVDELNNALYSLIKVAQKEAFEHELSSLTKNKVLNNSKLLRLSPFIDDKGLLRVGGRLSNSLYGQDKKYPILLPKNHRLTYLIVKHEHERTLHSGPQLLLASLREQYWPISGRSITKTVVHKCITCFRANPKFSNPLMGSLPTERTTPSPPFHVSGVDYCGPILIKDKKGRGCRTTKAYICMFICFAIKAIHIELVSDLTTEAFIAALKRFVARRGKPSKIFSDNATNFIGADNELKAFIQGMSSVKENTMFENFVLSEGISWKFIPPRSPHFGGLWESGIKTLKFHLKRVVGNAMLTFEELYTVMTQIEAVVNSRPLSALSSDPNDPNPLTPAHFLIGRSLVAVPEPNYIEVKESRLSRFQRVQQIVQHFWTRWSKEYLGELQQRTKWQQNQQNHMKEGAMVILREDNVPVSKWHLGRVVSVQPGADGVVRVATVKTNSGVYKRSVTKLCPLPVA